MTTASPRRIGASDSKTRSQLLDAAEQLLLEEGYAAVGGSVSVPRTFGSRRRARELAAWAPGVGRVPGFPHPLLCPSVVAGAGFLYAGDVIQRTIVSLVPFAANQLESPTLVVGIILVTGPVLGLIGGSVATQMKIGVGDK